MLRLPERAKTGATSKCEVQYPVMSRSIPWFGLPPRTLGEVLPVASEGAILVTMTWQEHIVVDSAVLTGKPVIRGTRLAVEFIVNLLAEGWSEGDILQNYPGLTGEHVRACLAYARERLSEERVFPAPA